MLDATHCTRTASGSGSGSLGKLVLTSSPSCCAYCRRCLSQIPSCELCSPSLSALQVESDAVMPFSDIWDGRYARGGYGSGSFFVVASMTWEPVAQSLPSVFSRRVGSGGGMCRYSSQNPYSYGCRLRLCAGEGCGFRKPFTASKVRRAMELDAESHLWTRSRALLGLNWPA
jgi:hypothetical protein